MTINHTLQLRVYYEDTDAAGIVYHASYLRFAERGRTEMLRAAGFAHAQLQREEGMAFAVTGMEIAFRAPARLDDLLEIRTRVAGVSGARLEMAQEIYREGALLTTMKVHLACLDRRGKAVRLPAKVKEIFEGGGPS